MSSSLSDIQSSETTNGHVNRLADVPGFRLPPNMPKQKKIAIVGTSLTSREAPFNEPDWQIWCVNNILSYITPIPRWDVLFDIHRHDFATEDPVHDKWLRQNH